MAVKKSIRVSSKAEELCKLLSCGPETNWSGTVNQVFDRYDFMIQQSIPELTENEKTVICSIYKDHEISQRFDLEINAFKQKVFDAIQGDERILDLCEEMDVNIKYLCERIDTLSPIQRLALIDMVQRNR